MSLGEILDALPALSLGERQVVLGRLQELEIDPATETPELIAAVDEGNRSADEESTFAIADARRRLAAWITK